jgi:hypothetical protein
MGCIEGFRKKMLTPTARWRRERSEREIIKEQSGAEAVKIASSFARIPTPVTARWRYFK